ncbi:hypothetical protein JCM8097_008378 [Rhodosporidiobolus ruineniae]
MGDSFLRDASARLRRTPSNSSSSSGSSHASSAPAPPAPLPPDPPRPSTGQEPSALSSLFSRLAASPPVKLVLVNPTELPVWVAHWPARVRAGGEGEEEERVELRSYRGTGVVAGSMLDENEGEMWDGEEMEVGAVKRPGRKGVLGGNEYKEGWIYLDLALPPPPDSPEQAKPYLLHLQLYTRLSTSGSVVAALGRFNLDSTSERPCPSGMLGRVEAVREGEEKAGGAPLFPSGLVRSASESTLRSAASSIASSRLTADSHLPASPAKPTKDRRADLGPVSSIRFHLPPVEELLEMRNVVDDSTREGRFWVPGKGVVVSSWVSVEGVSLSLMLGDEARYHEYYGTSHSAPSYAPSSRPATPASGHHRLSTSSHLSTASTVSSLSTLSVSTSPTKPRARLTSASSSSTLSSLALSSRSLHLAHSVSSPAAASTAAATNGMGGLLRTSKHVLEGLGWESCFLHVRRGREVLFERTVRVRPLDGSTIGAAVVSTVDTPAVFHPELDLAISYGFFDSGLARAKQMYIYVARRHTAWLAQLVEEDPRVLEVPFERMALAGSHDAGMLGTIQPELLDFLSRSSTRSRSPNDDGDDLPPLARALPLVRLLLSLLSTFGVAASRMLSNLSMTQKDSIRGQLGMGVRFFDFRPGFSLPLVLDPSARALGSAALDPTQLRHQHSIVPGVSYVMFLVDVLAFLAENEGEVVVVELKDDGFPFRNDVYPDPPSPSSFASSPSPSPVPLVLSMTPTTAHLSAALSAARASSTLAAREITIGSARDLKKTVGELLQSNTRLIIVDRVHEEERGKRDRWDRADSYTHDLYDTDDPTRVLSALNLAHEQAVARAAQARRNLDEERDEEEGKTEKPPTGTIYQLQATPTAQIWSDIGPSLSFSDASSLLVWSKARMDRVTYPWLAGRGFFDDGLVVFLNDFVDPSQVELALEKTRERVAVWLAKREHEREGKTTAEGLSVGAGLGVE